MITAILLTLAMAGDLPEPGQLMRIDRPNALDFQVVATLDAETELQRVDIEGATYGLVPVGDALVRVAVSRAPDKVWVDTNRDGVLSGNEARDISAFCMGTAQIDMRVPLQGGEVRAVLDLCSQSPERLYARIRRYEGVVAFGAADKTVVLWTYDGLPSGTAQLAVDVEDSGLRDIARGVDHSSRIWAPGGAAIFEVEGSLWSVSVGTDMVATALPAPRGALPDVDPLRACTLPATLPAPERSEELITTLEAGRWSMQPLAKLGEQPTAAKAPRDALYATLPIGPYRVPVAWHPRKHTMWVDVDLSGSFDRSEMRKVGKVFNHDYASYHGYLSNGQGRRFLSLDLRTYGADVVGFVRDFSATHQLPGGPVELLMQSFDGGPSGTSLVGMDPDGPGPLRAAWCRGAGGPFRAYGVDYLLWVDERLTAHLTPL